MKKIVSFLKFVVLSVILFGALVFHAFAGSSPIAVFENHETFNTLTDLAANSAYNNGTQEGSTGYEWTWEACQDGNKQAPPYAIDNVTPVLRHPSSFIQATIAGGISGFSLDYKRAYTSTTTRIVEVYINNELIASGVNCGGDTDLRTLEVSNLTISGSFTVKIKLQGSGTTNAQTCIDNFQWDPYGVQNPLVATPTFSPNGGAFNEAKTVTMACATEGAEIHYTMDGTDPTPSSTLYTSPISLSTTGNYAMKAIGVKAGYDNSGIASAVFSIKIYEPGECQVFVDFEDAVWSGTSYTPRVVTDQWGQWRVAGVVNPDQNDHFYDTRSIRLRGNTTDTLSNTNRVEMLFDRTNGIGTVSFFYASYSSHSGGTISLQSSIDQGVTWTTVETIANIPSWNAGGSKMLEASINIDIPNDVRIRITKLSQSGSTSVNIDNICITDYGTPTVATPIFSPNGGAFSTAKTITISCSTPGASIYYTINGPDPSASSTLYTAPIALNTNGIYLIKAIGIKTDWDDSPIASATFQINIIDPNDCGVYEDFEIMTPANPGYAGSVVTTPSGEWMILGYGIMDPNDRYFDTKSIRLRANNNDPATNAMTIPGNNTTGANVVQMQWDKPDGVGTVSFYYGSYSNHSGGIVFVEYSTDGGTTWLSPANNSVTSPSWASAGQMQPFSVAINIPGNVRVRIIKYKQSGTSNSVNIDNLCITDFILPAYTIAVSANPTEGGTVSGGGTYYQGYPATINAIPDVAYNFINWTEGANIVYTNPQNIFTVTANRILMANFQMKTYTMTASAGTNGAIYPSGVETVNYGATRTYTITPNSGYQISQVLVDGLNNTAAVASGSYTFSNITANHTISASFAPGQYTLTLDASTGTVSGNQTMTIPVTYLTPIGYIPNAIHYNCPFQGWFIDNTQITASTTWIYPSDQTAMAVFNYPIVATNLNSDLGTISPTGTINYSLGEEVDYICTPVEGAHITTITVDGAVVYTGNNELTQPYTYSFTNINNYHTIRVGFAWNCYALNPDNVVGTGATLTMSPASCVQHASNVTFFITTNRDHSTQILIDGIDQGVSNVPSYSFVRNNVTEPLPVIEIFTAINQYTILATPVSNPMGSIEPSGTVTVNCGNHQMFEFSTEVGYRVKTLTVDGIVKPVPPSYSYTFPNVMANHTIDVDFEEFPQYLIYFGPGAADQQGGSVFPSDRPNVIHFVAVDSGEYSFQFSIVPDVGYVIDKVYVDDIINPLAANTGFHTFYRLNSNHTIFATFKPITLTITATTGFNGNMYPSGAVQVVYGTHQTFYATPDFGFELATVFVDGMPDAGASVTGNYTFNNVTENHTISAHFVRTLHQISTTAGIHGEITPQNPMVLHGYSQTFTFLPQTGYQIDQVFIDGFENPAAAQAGSYTFINVIQPHSIQVTFTIIQLTITSTCTDGGTVTPLGAVLLNYGDHSPIFVFTPDEGYHIQSVLIDGVNDAQAVEFSEHRFMDVIANHTIYVIYKKDFNIIMANASIGGHINPSGVIPVPFDEYKTFTFAPIAGYELARVIVDGVNDPDAVENGFYTFFNVSDDHSIAAQFEKIMYNVFYEPNPGAHVIPADGSTTPVGYGESYKFKVVIEDAYSQSHFVVRVNGIVLNPLSGVYAITNIFTDKVITIEGLAMNQYKITAQAFTGGTISPAGIFTVTHHDNKTFEIKPNAGFIVRDIVVNGESKGAVTTYTFFDIRGNSTIKAYFTVPQGIDENNANSILIFSANNIVTILNENLIPIQHVEIIDMFGRFVWRGLAPDVKTEITLDVAAGIYGVRVFIGDHQNQTTKVMIQ